MGLLSPYVYKTKDGKKFWLHMKKRGKVTLYYFSKDPVGALFSIPKGYTVVENKRTGFPFLKKKSGGGLFSIFKKGKKEATQEEKSA
ncbi:MAG: hypothetical protein QXK49_01780 [Candidatus Aenigmatarchaeota archaeon]